VFRSNLLVLLAVAAVTVGLWAMVNRPDPEPSWPERIDGFAFSPMRMDDDPTRGRFPTVEEIEADLALLSGQTRSIRSYTVEGTLNEIPVLARRHDLRVALGVWLDDDLQSNTEQLERMRRAIRNQLHVNRIIVGNETLLRRELSVDEVSDYLDWVHERFVAKVSTAEPWYLWMRYPELVEHVDFITVHLLPYWEGVDVERAVDYVADRINDLQAAYPDKPIVIGEVGWPSRGRTRGKAVASPANEAKFLRRFLARAEREGWDYYLMEAFDQPWKRVSEGDVGAYWGVYDVFREPKFAFEAPVRAIPEWKVLAGLSVVIAALVFALLVIDSATLRRRGRGFLAVVAFTAATTAVWVVYEYTQQYLTPQSLLAGIFLAAGMIGVMLVILTEAHEWAEAHWITTRRRAFPTRNGDRPDYPRVSIHVPAHNEPPQMLIQTLDALAALDYPDYEVLVIDNNTPDPQTWEPVRAHCEQLGRRFRFFHVDDLAGFKAGALNYALRHTDPQAQIVAVIDSDYVVTPDWLRDLSPAFDNPRIAIVQAPQDYRDGADSAFKAMCYAEYRGFFYIGMVTRNERNAIIQHGTMTMVRRDALAGVGGWAQWTVTEDAELGLRIFEHGYEAIYVPHSYGRGLMPDNFVDYKTQRFRWAFGAMQIMRAHAAALLGLRRSHLSRGQRYHFFAGWLPWLADGFNLGFNLAALAWSLGMLYLPQRFDPPLIVFSALPLALFAFKAAKLIVLYRSRMEATGRQTLAAAWAGLALTHTIGMAVIAGLLRKRMPFLRTPKLAKAPGPLGALWAAREEALLVVALSMAALLVNWSEPMGGVDLLLWTSVLLIQAIPNLAAVTLSLVAAFPRVPARWIGAASSESTPVSG
jgi:exo-beta-1,3-glucanase (GH17 family)/cellulose synthase/poly-beta-1,6-N-acetylglucosamine synthase-like glycosyltransferase